jgi:hypothetical protein
MKALLTHPRFILLVLLVSLVLSAVGCATSDPENVSVRPWNSPRGWETGGLPSSMNEGH